MHEILVFSVSGNTELDSVSKLKEALSGTGISVRLEKTKGSGHTHLIFNYDTDRVRQRKSRNAGRKEITTASPLTCAEVSEMRKTMPESAILDALQISRSTFYRRLRKLDGNYSPDWYF